ncbi:MAG: hypothetical protein IJE65_03800 [Clostridia bacterium]|nr:hypothetical protein [Clostridia bacterium]
MRYFRVISIILSCLILFSSCNSLIVSDDTTSGGKNTSVEEIGIALPYSSTDSLNPYVAVTKVNQELSMLLYDPLIKLDEAFSPVYYLADEISIDKQRVTVTLKDVRFTDNSLLTADDVKYSFNQLNKTENKYKLQLSNIKSCSIFDQKTIVFDLYKYDPYFINLLDFPIFKNGTAETKDSNDRTIPPIGCGRYVIDSENSYRLIPNKDYYNGKTKFDYINLIDTPDNESLSHMVEVSAIDMIYSEFSDSTIPKMSGTQNAVPLTNIVYLGINPNNYLLSKTEMRVAISSALSRDEIVKSAYFGFATAATGIFPANWKEAAELQHISSEQNIKQVVAYLEQLGYNSKDTDGYYVAQSGERITFSLLYNKENISRKYAAGLIVQQLKKVGIEIIVTEAESFEEYSQRLENNNYDIYIGEIKLAKNMDLRDVFSKNVISGINESYTSEMIDAFYEEKADISTVISSCASEMPIIPICNRKGVSIYSDSIKDINVSISDIYTDL